ncbi:hypothetical protein GIB67_021743 [Kingdonia uniflora]|uniref:Inhibitor I9 domain-containing protein n=1 Tax=Kingdonia uniflora TaxID=39325 RepID=A0A7J7M9J3_9MAGN|nr:hypothetical protein GIB67_021743 [Kingdonia uniflora]
MEKSVMPKAFSSHCHWYSAILDSLKTDSDKVSTSVPPKLLYTCNHAIHKFSVVLSPKELEALKKTLRVWPESNSFRDDGMGEIPRRWKGTCKLDIQFKSLMSNRKLIGVRYFNKGVLAQDPNISFFYNLPRDETGGIVPCTRLAVYKVTWSRKGSLTSDVIASMDQALANGVDIISMSMIFLGALIYENQISIVSFAAMEKGVLVSSSARNRGSNLMTVAGNPWSLTVGVSTIERQLAGTLTLGNGKTNIR